MKYLIAIATAILVSGCSSQPVSDKTAYAVEQDKIFQPDLLQPNPKYASVKFLRDQAFIGIGAGCPATLSINGKPAFSIATNEHITVWLSPGQYSFLLQQGKGSICRNQLVSLSSTLTSGTNETYRIMLTSQGSLLMARIE